MEQSQVSLRKCSKPSVLLVSKVAKIKGTYRDSYLHCSVLRRGFSLEMLMQRDLVINHFHDFTVSIKFFVTVSYVLQQHVSNLSQPVLGTYLILKGRTRRNLHHYRVLPTIRAHGTGLN